VSQVLKTPWPYFGGKSRVADIVWARLGDVDNFIEPFCGSAAVLLRRPHPSRIETINDADCMVANFWRATQHNPERVAEFADGPVNEADLHARHKWLVLSDEAKTFRKRMRSEPDYYDPKFAGWWCWGLCCWIGGGWCTTNAAGDDAFSPNTTPALAGSDGAGLGVVRAPAGERRCKLTGGSPGSGALGTGVHSNGPDAALSPGRKPRIDGGANQAGHGIHAKGELTIQLPYIAGLHGDTGRGLHNDGIRGPSPG
jgi:hypothetical protein